MKPTDPLPALIAAALGLRSKDLAEIGGFTDRHARDILACKVGCPDDVGAALDDLQEDVDTLTDQMIADAEEGRAEIPLYRTNDDLRAAIPSWPGRGHAAGGFVGAYRVAALTAYEHMDRHGVEVVLTVR